MKTSVIVLTVFFGVSLFFNVTLGLAVHHDGKVIDQANVELAQARATVAQANAVISKPPRPLPVEVNSRKAILGNGLVIQFQETLPPLLTLDVRCTNPKLQTHKDFRIDVGPKSPGEIGYAQGWTAASGDTVEISCQGYDPAKFTVQ